MYKPELKHRRIGIVGILCFSLFMSFPQDAMAVTEQYIGSFGGGWDIPNTLVGDDSSYRDDTIKDKNTGTYSSLRLEKTEFHKGTLDGQIVSINEKALFYIDEINVIQGEQWGHTNYGGVSGWLLLSLLNKVSDIDIAPEVGTTCFVSFSYNKGAPIYGECNENTPELGRVPYGEVVVIQAMENLLAYVNASGVEGWVPIDRLTPIISGGTYCAEATEDGATILYKEPSLDSDGLAIVNNGKEFFVQSISNGFGFASVDGKEGWLPMYAIALKTVSN